ncbi:MAG: PaaI family thioesterase [Micromonosporaceae bacterium]
MATAGDIVHGGAIGSLIDTASAVAAWSNHDPADGVRWGTTSISVSFLAAARGTLRAEAVVTRRGRTLCFCRVEVLDADDTLIAEALVTYRLG